VQAAQLAVTITDATGRGVPDIVIVAEPGTAAALKRAAPHTAVIDQHNMHFVPDILVVQTGTGIDFPNSDQIQHQVYSFSPAKTFQLSLYAGHKYPPVIFDRPGLVTLGCNIHDTMIAYIYVTDSPFFGRSDAAGKLELRGLPAGNYSLIAWHPGLQEPAGSSPRQSVTLGENDHAEARLQLTHAMRAAGTHGGDKRWTDY